MKHAFLVKILSIAGIVLCGFQFIDGMIRHLDIHTIAGWLTAMLGDLTVLVLVVNYQKVLDEQGQTA